MPRSVALWIAKHDDQAVPAQVKLRIWRAQDGVCGICGRKIMPADPKALHHRLALILGGRHAEDNLTWTHAACNANEAKTEVAIRAKTDAVSKRHLGIKSTSALAGRTREQKRADRDAKSAGRIPLPPRKLPPGFVSAASGDQR